MTFFGIDIGAHIDTNHHQNQAKRAIHETIAFDDAVKTSVRLLDETESLIVVSADHGHPMVIQGYPIRGNPILGK